MSGFWILTSCLNFRQMFVNNQVMQLCLNLGIKAFMFSFSIVNRLKSLENSDETHTIGLIISKFNNVFVLVMQNMFGSSSCVYRIFVK